VSELNREPGAMRVDLYPVEVAFEFVRSPEERAWFKNLPTSFELPRETIDRLRAVGRRLLAEDPEFQKLLKTLRGQP
jgi:NTE family protein